MTAYRGSQADRILRQWLLTAGYPFSLLHSLTGTYDAWWGLIRRRPRVCLEDQAELRRRESFQQLAGLPKLWVCPMSGSKTRGPHSQSRPMSSIPPGDQNL